MPRAAPFGARLGLSACHALRRRIFGAARRMSPGRSGAGKRLLVSFIGNCRSEPPPRVDFIVPDVPNACSL
jgi:hypothetical protein